MGFFFLYTSTGCGNLLFSPQPVVAGFMKRTF